MLEYVALCHLMHIKVVSHFAAIFQPCSEHDYKTKPKNNTTILIIPWRALEDPHEQPGGLHGDLLVEPLELEPDVDDVGLGLLSRLALERQLAGKQDIEKDTQAPDVRLGEGLTLLDDFGSLSV